jgi:hypothetical protein
MSETGQEATSTCWSYPGLNAAERRERTVHVGVIGADNALRIAS